MARMSEGVARVRGVRQVFLYIEIIPISKQNLKLPVDVVYNLSVRNVVEYV